MAAIGHHGYDSDGNVQTVKVADGHLYKGWTMVNRLWHKLTIEDLQDGCCGGHHGYHNKMLKQF